MRMDKPCGVCLEFDGVAAQRHQQEPCLWFQDIPSSSVNFLHSWHPSHQKKKKTKTQLCAPGAALSNLHMQVQVTAPLEPGLFRCKWARTGLVLPAVGFNALNPPPRSENGTESCKPTGAQLQVCCACADCCINKRIYSECDGHEFMHVTSGSGRWISSLWLLGFFCIAIQTLKTQNMYR